MVKGVSVHARTVINAAGHGAVAIAKKTTGLASQHIPRIYPIRGHYFEHSGKLPFSMLIYPAPGRGHTRRARDHGYRRAVPFRA